MSVARKVLLALVACVVVAAGWLWWQRPREVDMAAYAPGDALLYVEIDNLPDALGALASTDAWRTLAPEYGLRTDLANAGWLGRLIEFTGLGPAESVVLSRAQVALAVMSFERIERPGGDGEVASATIRPRVALVAETHAGHARARAVAERLLGDLARQAYDSPRVERGEANGAAFTTWTAREDERRKIVAAVTEGTVIVGNDREAVESCLAVLRGERPPLSSDLRLAEMRARMDAPGQFAFGYATPGGTAKLVELAALAYLGRGLAEPRLQSVVASLLPQLTSKTLGAAGWVARREGGGVEDRYFLALQNGAGARMKQALDGARGAGGEGAGVEFLPADVYQYTRYQYREPEAAWRGFNSALSSQLDALTAPFASRFLEAALEPYGIDDAQAFLSAVGPELLTARLDGEVPSTVTVVQVRDRAKLETLIRRRLGAGASSETVAGETMLSSTDAERGAASFVGEYLLSGDPADVRRCLEARAGGRTLARAEQFRRAERDLFDAQPAALTLTDDRESAVSFAARFARAGATNATGAQIFGERLPQRTFAVTASRFIDEGYERRARSSFGLIGTLVTQFAPRGE